MAGGSAMSGMVLTAGACLAIAAPRVRPALRRVLEVRFAWPAQTALLFAAPVSTRPPPAHECTRRRGRSTRSA